MLLSEIFGFGKPTVHHITSDIDPDQYYIMGAYLWGNAFDGTEGDDERIVGPFNTSKDAKDFYVKNKLDWVDAKIKIGKLITKADIEQYIQPHLDDPDRINIFD